METVLVVIHLMVVAALVALVLLQRSEGGALGIGGGGNFLATRSRANVLTRTTAYLAAGFFATSIALTVLAKLNAPGSIMDTIPVNPVTGEATTATDRPTAGGILDLLPPRGGTATTPTTTTTIPSDIGAPLAPVTNTPAAETPAATVPTFSIPSGQ